MARVLSAAMVRRADTHKMVVCETVSQIKVKEKASRARGSSRRRDMEKAHMQSMSGMRIRRMIGITTLARA